jgi:hypothetical protein
MVNVLFVHGTGVREADYELSSQRVRQALASLDAEYKFQACFWAGKHGAQLNAGGGSIPLYDKTLAAGVEGEIDYERALWQVLYADPLYELRVLALDAGGQTAFVPGKPAPGQVLADRVSKLAPSESLAQKMNAAGIREEFEEAKRAVLNSRECHDALQAAREPLDPYRAAMARAIVAKALETGHECGDSWTVLPDASLRDEIIRELSNELGHSSLALAERAARALFGFAQRLGAMDHVQRRRGAISNAAYPFAGDILLYQACGDGIRDFIRGQIQQLTAPVILLAHSLGGIASLELLVLEDLRPKVKLLVTVGSQAPFLYEIRALKSLRHPDPLPDHFPPWLNIYDLADFLSYIGTKLFPGRVQDERVNSRQPFPQSHSAYWSNRATWAAIDAKYREIKSAQK